MRTKKIEITDDVAAVLRRCTFTETTVVLPTEQLARPLYDAVNKVLDAQGGKWNRKLKAHVFPEGCDPRQVFAEALVAGEIVHDKKSRQAFYTPPTQAALAAKRAEIAPGQDVLEPSAGGGSLIAAALTYGPRNVMAVELDANACIRLRKEFALIPSVRVTEGDFLQLVPATGMGRTPANALVLHDRVVMNPPFADGQEVEHIRHAFRFLKPGGRLVSIASAGLQTRTDRRYEEFRDWLTRNTEDRAFEKLDPKAFRQSGTDVQAIMLSCRYRPA